MKPVRRWIARFDILLGDSNDEDIVHALNLATSRPMDEITGLPRVTLCGFAVPTGQQLWYYVTPRQIEWRELCGACSYLGGRPTATDIAEAG